MSNEWGPWIDGSVPPPVGAYIRMKVINMKKLGDMTHEAVVLSVDGEDVNVSPKLPFASVWELDCYRIRKPRALIHLIDMVENLPAPTERVEA